jgi:hypothetical protein
VNNADLHEILQRPAVAARNPALGGLAGPERKSNPGPALVKDAQSQPRRQGSVAVVCQIISLRHRVLDSDNNAAGGNKALQDAISRHLAIDDGSETIRFEFAQCHTSGDEGTIVRIAWV